MSMAKRTMWGYRQVSIYDKAAIPHTLSTQDEALRPLVYSKEGPATAYAPTQHPYVCEDLVSGQDTACLTTPCD